MATRDEARKELARRELLRRQGRTQFNQESQAFEAQSQPGEDFDFNAGQMLRNVPGSAVQLAKDVTAPIHSPKQTIVGMRNLLLGFAEKIKPGEQGNEKHADQVIQFFSDRFGGVDNLQRTLQNDPLGLLSDMAGVLSGGGAIAAKLPGKVGAIGKAAETVGRTIDPVAKAGQATAVAASRIPGIQGGAEKLFASGAKFPTSRANNPTRTRRTNQQNVQTALKERIPLTEKGVGRVETRIGKIGDEIDALIDAADPDTRISAQAIINQFDDAIDAADIPGDPRRGQQVSALAQVRKDFIESLDGADSLTVREAQTAKQRIGQRMNFESAPGSSTFIGQEGEQAIRRATRAGLEGAVPGIGELNARQGALLELQNPLSRSANRIGNRDTFGLSQMLGAGFGGAAGSAFGGAGTGAGAALGLGASFINSPRVQARVAILMQQLIDAGRSPQMAAALAPLLAAQGAKAAGRAGQQEELTR